MSKEVLVDTNILIRLFTKDNDTQVEQLVCLMEQGEIEFRVLSIVLIEVYWVLRSVYKFEKGDILAVFEDFIEAEGVHLDEEGLVQRVLTSFRSVNVDFIDVYTAEKSGSLELPVLTWNVKDFRKLECEFYSPRDLI